MRTDTIDIKEPTPLTVFRTISNEQGNNQRTTYTLQFDSYSTMFTIVGEWERLAFEDLMKFGFDSPSPKPLND